MARPLDEQYDTQMEVERDPCGAWQAIQSLAAESDRLRDALERIHQWSQSYPDDVFPEPDFKHVALALSRAGLSLGTVSASNMRHVSRGVGKIAAAALNK